MAKQIAIVLNTGCHVETALSIYFTLTQMDGLEPVIVPLCGNSRSLFSFLTKCRVNYVSPEVSESDFDKAIIVTVYPPGTNAESFPKENHPLVRGFTKRRLLISHRCTHPKESYLGEDVVCLSPLSRSCGVDYIYQCENPALETPSPPFDDGHMVFLVQGNMKSRDIALIKESLSFNKSKRIKVLFAGNYAKTLSIVDERTEKHENLSHEDFFSVCSRAHFIIPLIGPSSSYVKQRFSSSYTISFASLRPLLTHKVFYELYPVPSICYESNQEFHRKLNDCLSMDQIEYSSMVAEYRIKKETLRWHNINILTKYL